MNDINKELEQMVKDMHRGASVEEAIRKTLGDSVAGQSGKIAEVVHDWATKADRLEEKYSSMNMQAAVFQEIDERCGEDLSAQFRMISDLKYVNALRNMEISKEVLKSEGLDIEFMRETLTRTHETEQRMAEEISVEELEALRNELAALFPDERNGMSELLEQLPEEEAWASVRDKAMEASDNITSQTKEDIAVLTAALLLKEHPEISADEAAAAAIVQAAENEGGKKLQFIWMVIPVALAATVSGLTFFLWGFFTGLVPVAELGLAAAVAGAAALSLMVLLALGEGAYKLVKKLIPHIKATWRKVTPYVKAAAKKVKTAIASVIGIAVNKVFRPALRWVSNTAVPVLNEKVIHPLKRRLQMLLGWLQEKKEQVRNFVKNAMQPEMPVEEQVEEEEFESVYENEDENEDEDEFVFAN